MDGVTIKNIEPVHVDERGAIYDLVNTSLEHVGYITSEPNSVRGNHYHKTSHQFTFVLSGSFEVALAQHDSPEKKEIIILRAGQLIEIKPLVIHAFKALEKSLFIEVDTLSREGSGYEDDVIRVKLL